MRPTRRSGRHMRAVLLLLAAALAALLYTAAPRDMVFASGDRLVIRDAHPQRTLAVRCAGAVARGEDHVSRRGGVKERGEGGGE